MIGVGNGGLMTLEFQIVVISEQVMEPLHHLLGLINPARCYKLGDLAAQTGRAADDTLVVFLQVILIGTGMGVETVGPGAGYNLDEVMVTFLVLGKEYQVVVGSVQFLTVTLFLATGSHIDLAANYRLEMPTLFLEVLIDLVTVILELLNAHHVAVVSYGNAPHTVCYRLVHQLLYIGLTVKQRVLRMDMKMNEFLHRMLMAEKVFKVTLSG